MGNFNIIIVNGYYFEAPFILIINLISKIEWRKNCFGAKSCTYWTFRRHYNFSCTSSWSFSFCIFRRLPIYDNGNPYRGTLHFVFRFGKISLLCDSMQAVNGMLFQTNVLTWNLASIATESALGPFYRILAVSIVSPFLTRPLCITTFYNKHSLWILYSNNSERKIKIDKTDCSLIFLVSFVLPQLK